MCLVNCIIECFLYDNNKVLNDIFKYYGLDKININIFISIFIFKSSWIGGGKEWVYMSVILKNRVWNNLFWVFMRGFVFFIGMLVIKIILISMLSF